MHRRLGGPQSRSERHREVKILAPTGTLNSDGRPARSQSPYQLRYKESHINYGAKLWKVGQLHLQMLFVECQETNFQLWRPEYGA
jgi:hypothetical protein